MLLYILQYLFVIIITTNVMVVHGQNASYTTWKELHMATHECSACLQETIQGATDVVGTLVLPNSVCTAPGGGRLERLLQQFKVIISILCISLSFSIAYIPYLYFIRFR